jgi:hypothetical protein
MQNLIMAMAISGLLLVGRANAEPAAQSAVLKHQVVACMTKSMSADRALSYNDAMKTCKQRVGAPGNSQNRKDELAANTAPEASASKAP